MIDPTVRRAAQADIAQLIELESEARASLIGQRGGDRWLATHPARRDGWAESVADSGALVAHIGDVIVGYLAIVRTAQIARVEEVYVTPGAREVGFGDALLEQASEIARDWGCTIIEGEALPGDRETKNLYERAGITARLIVVSRSLVQ